MAKKKAKKAAKKFDINKLRSFCDTVIKRVPTPEWPDMGVIYVKSMTGKSRDSYEFAIMQADEKAEASGKGSRMDNIRANFVVAVACDKDGKLLFKPEHAEWLGDMSAKALDRIYDAGKALAGISAKDIAEMEKSLEGAQS